MKLSSRKKRMEWCKRKLQEKVAVNINEYRHKRRWVSPLQAVAVSYSQTRKNFPKCKTFLGRKKSQKKYGRKKQDSGGTTLDEKEEIIKHYEYSSVMKKIENDNEFVEYKSENKNGNIKAEFYYKNKLTGYDYVVMRKDNDKFEKIENQPRTIEDEKNLEALQEGFLPREFI